eukprot:Gb_12419 [translate_table: standard]
MPYMFLISWGCRQKRSKKAIGDNNYENNVNGLVCKEISRSVKKDKARSPRNLLSWSTTERVSVSSPRNKFNSISRTPQPSCAHVLCPKLKFKALVPLTDLWGLVLAHQRLLGTPWESNTSHRLANVDQNNIELDATKENKEIDASNIHNEPYVPYGLEDLYGNNIDANEYENSQIG